jgi:hypothetical protein
MAVVAKEELKDKVVCRGQYFAARVFGGHI